MSDVSDDDLPPLVFSTRGGTTPAPGGAPGDDDNLPPLIFSNTHDQQAKAPAEPKDATLAPEKDEDLTLGDALRRGSHLSDAGEVAGDIAHGVTHPIETLSALGDIGKGAVSQAAGALGVKQDPTEKANSERVIDALEDHFKNSYGSWKGFKNAIANHPVSTAMDLTTIVPGGLGMGAKVAGESSAVGRALTVAQKATAAANPASLAATAAKGAIKAPTWAARKLSSVTADVPDDVMKLAESAGATKDPAIRDAFMRHYTGQGSADEVVQAARDALEKAKSAQVSDYLNTKNGQAAAAAAPDLTNISNTIDRMPKEINRGNARFDPVLDAQGQPTGQFKVSGIPPGQFNDKNRLIAEIKGLVDNYKNDPSRHNYLDLDLLKQAVFDKMDELNMANDRHGMAVHGAIKDELENIAPGYQDLMEHWQDSLRGVNNISKGLSMGKNVDAMRALNRMMRVQDSPEGQRLIGTLADQDPRLPYMLAGQTLRPWAHHGLRGQIDAIMAFGLGSVLHPAAVGSWAAASPKIMGGGQYAAGALQRGLSSAKIPAAAEAIERTEDAEKGPAAPPSAAPAPQASAEEAPRGLRNNNPSNIEDGSFAKSQPGYKGSDGRFAIFDSPESGMAAAARLVRNQGRLGANTIRKLVERRTPLGDNPRAAVENKIATIARRLGIHPDQRLNTDDPDLQRSFAEAEKVAENGHAAGGRIRRASGGRTVNHGSEAAKLVAQAERGLKHQNKKTEPLLEMHDDAVAHALKTADKYI